MTASSETGFSLAPWRPSAASYYEDADRNGDRRLAEGSRWRRSGLHLRLLMQGLVRCDRPFCKTWTEAHVLRCLECERRYGPHPEACCERGQMPADPPRNRSRR
jgi:hypothetical protein